MAQAGAEVAMPLTSALQRVQSLTHSGRIGRADLQALDREIDRARRAAMTAQLLARIAAGGVRPQAEAVELAAALRQIAGPCELGVLRPVRVVLDPALLASLLQAVVDWACDHAVSRVQLSLHHGGLPPCATIVARFRSRADGAPGPAADGRPGTLDWLLLGQCAQAAGLVLDRADRDGECTLELGFPGAEPDPPQVTGFEGLTVIEHGPQVRSARLLAGHHVLVVSARSAVRAEVRDAIRHTGLMSDYLASVDEAREFCRDGLPHAVVYDAVLAGAPMSELRQSLRAEAPSLAVIEVAEGLRGYTPAQACDDAVARVGRSTLGSTLPAALVCEITGPR
jgi:hypothetical protein